jgi:hypothetical protein
VGGGPTALLAMAFGVRGETDGSVLIIIFIISIIYFFK